MFSSGRVWECGLSSLALPKVQTGLYVWEPWASGTSPEPQATGLEKGPEVSPPSSIWEGGGSRTSDISIRHQQKHNKAT